jgi:hypothetical protein
VNFLVLEAVADVEVSEFLGALLVVEDEAGPHDGADVHSSVVLLPALYDPQTLWLVFSDRLEEVRVEWCARLVQLLLVGVRLDIAEV